MCRVRCHLLLILYIEDVISTCSKIDIRYIFCGISVDGGMLPVEQVLASILCKVSFFYPLCHSHQQAIFLEVGDIMGCCDKSSYSIYAKASAALAGEEIYYTG